jgi:gamma-glutamyl:cysteine ligase YbdK (ATP-grasp superfamily)
MKVLGPEHEFSVVDKDLKPLPIVDQIIKDWTGVFCDFVDLPKFSFGKEASLHTLEIKARKPFRSPEIFEKRMHGAVKTLLDLLDKKYNAMLLGTGMHPLLKLDDTNLWTHSNFDLLQQLENVFNLRHHGWLNIQSFQLNLPYYKEANAVQLYNALTHISTYLPAISASSPICEGKFTHLVDSRLNFYKSKSIEIPSLTGDVIPEYVSSFKQFKTEVINRYSLDMEKAGITAEKLLYVDYMNLRGIRFRFNREAIEIRVMDEQECIKSDVAFSCFIRAAVRGLIETKSVLPNHELLINDYDAIVKEGLNAEIKHPNGKTAREVSRYFFSLASDYANQSEKKYLWIIKKRIENGNLSDLIQQRVLAKAKKTDLNQAVKEVYQDLANNLSRNQPYF